MDIAELRRTLRADLRRELASPTLAPTDAEPMLQLVLDELRLQTELLKTLVERERPEAMGK